MLTRRRSISAFGVLALGLFLAAPTHGSGTALHAHKITFRGPVRLPGVTLTAGSYIFERVRAQSTPRRWRYRQSPAATNAAQ